VSAIAELGQALDDLAKIERLRWEYFEILQDAQADLPRISLENRKYEHVIRILESTA
jgi:hypothetical protein